jgi:hypothetical protein
MLMKRFGMICKAEFVLCLGAYCFVERAAIYVAWVMARYVTTKTSSSFKTESQNTT